MGVHLTKRPSCPETELQCDSEPQGSGFSLIVVFHVVIFEETRERSLSTNQRPKGCVDGTARKSGQNDWSVRDLFGTSSGLDSRRSIQARVAALL